MAFEVEVWVEYGIGSFTFLLRFFARWKVVGIRNFAWDDFFSFIAMLMFTSDAAVVYIIDQKGSFVGLNEVTANELTNAQVHDYTIGSKALFTAWLTYVTLIWSLKASLLFFYSRLTLQLGQQKFIKIMACICAVAYIATILVLFLHCMPIERNWQIKPYAGDECTLTVFNYIFVAIANVFTDAGILAIPIPLIYSVRIPVHKKIIISLLLCSGIFIITAALLRCILSLKTNGDINNSTIWGIRETFVSVLAVSAPAIRPIFSKSRWVISGPDFSPHVKTEDKPALSRRNRTFREMARRRGLEFIDLGSNGTILGSNGYVEKNIHREDLEKGEYYSIEMLPPQQSTTHSSTFEIVNLSEEESLKPLSNQKRSNSLRIPDHSATKSNNCQHEEDGNSDMEEQLKDIFTLALMSWVEGKCHDADEAFARGLKRGSPHWSGPVAYNDGTAVQLHNLLGMKRPPYKMRSHTAT